MTRHSSVFSEYRRIKAEAHFCGEDISVTLVGGSLEHIGAVSLAVYEPERDSATVSTICSYGHRDDYLASMYAKRISSSLKCTVSVSAGVHIDNASAEDIKELSAEAESALSILLAGLKEEKSEKSI